MPELYLVRHGETEWSRSGQHTGTTDLPLTEAGVAAARALRSMLGHLDNPLVLTSPLQRARETCRLAGLDASAQVTADLVEWNYGDYEGRTTPDIRAERPGWLLWRDGAPGGEVAAEVGRRVDRVIEQVRGAARNGGRDAVVFAHGHVLRVLGARWIGLPPQDGSRFALSTASVCELGWEREIPVFRRWNDTSHLA